MPFLGAGSVGLSAGAERAAMAQVRLAEPLGRRDHGRVDSAQREIRVGAPLGLTSWLTRIADLTPQSALVSSRARGA